MSIRAATVEGRPCTKTAAHVVDGKSVRYASTGNCVLCAHEFAAKQTRQRQEARERTRLARQETHGP